MYPLLLLASAATLILPVEFHKQEHELSCEAAALTIVLRSYGIPVEESEVIKKMPFDRTPRQGAVWGDPERGFVGDIDGVMGETGYGIHWTALARTAAHWRKTSVIDGGSLQTLISHLDSGRPVIAWGSYGKGKRLSWKTPRGREILTLNTEHARVVYGYFGKRSNPDGFFVMDPLDGAQYRSTADFLADWDSFGRKGVVVYR